jgi:death-on-curing protein
MTGARYLTPRHLVRIADIATGGHAQIRDRGLIESAAQRPATALFGEEQYPSLLDKAAALIHSIARFHPLVDGNKRLAWLSGYTFLALNGVDVTATNEQAYELIMAVAAGRLDDVPGIAKALEPLLAAA